jgi:predicted MFS family arabinose efflux permease
MALFSTIMNVGAFVGPMVGVALSELWSIRTVLLIGGGVRLGGALLFHVLRPREQEGGSVEHVTREA